VADGILALELPNQFALLMVVLELVQDDFKLFF